MNSSLTSHRYFLACFLTLLACTTLVAITHAGPTPEPTTESTISPATAPTFPQSWVGHWKGPMSVTSPQGKQSLRMELIVAPTGDPKRFTWTIVYDGPQGRQERPYFLDVVDAAAGRYVIDEGNDVRLSATLLNSDTLTGAFDVGETSLVSTDRLDPATGTLDAQIVSYRRPATPTTRPVEAAPGFAVTPFEVTAVQRATLRRE